jgi:60 kDa SS-A/Ro ribonucleoprotein
MANKKLFKSLVGKLIPATNAFNEEFAPAYALSPKHQLAQYAATGCLNTTFYATADEQLAKVVELCAEVEAEFIAKTAVFCRERGFMKDMPALLAASLSVQDRELLALIFPRVIDNAKMLRNFVQIVRSGVVGRKSLGTAPKRLVREWLDARDPATLFRSNVGQDPSLADIVKMVHPKPKDREREALFGYFIGRDYAFDAMPAVAREYELFKYKNKDDSREVPDVPFQMLTALDLGTPEWTAIARRASWQMTRMNLNTFARHGVFGEPDMTELIANRLRDAKAIAKARVFPYQLLVAYTMANANADIPREVCDALQDAMEIAMANVPVIEGRVFVCPDVSGSMMSPVTGHRAGATTSVRCIDVAALVAAAVLRKNPHTEVLPFEFGVVKVALNSRDSVMTNAAKLASIGGGGTNCSAPLAQLNHRKAKGDLVIFVSDYESWVDASGRRGTEMMREWNVFKQRNPRARLACIDVQPYRTVQAIEREDILNVGGFSDQVFDVVSKFTRGELNGDHWIGVIESVTL